MEANGRVASDIRGIGASHTGVGKESSSARARREKKRFWIENPRRRFVVYFCVLVTAEVLVVGILHRIFHLV